MTTTQTQTRTVPRVEGLVAIVGGARAVMFAAAVGVLPVNGLTVSLVIGFTALTALGR